MAFINFLTYMKHLGEKALVFFPSKTDLISITDESGDVTEELLSERLDTLLTKDGDASDVTVTFQKATEKANIQSGDSLATAFGKLAKFCFDLETMKSKLEQIDEVFICDIELTEVGEPEIFDAYGFVYYETDSTGSHSHIGSSAIEIDNDTYELRPGMLVYVCNTVDASEDSVGYYRCIKEGSFYYSCFDATQYAYDHNALTLFEYLGKSSIGLKIYAPHADKYKVKILEDKIKILEEEKAKEFPISIDLLNASSDIQSFFGYVGVIDSTVAKWSGGSSGGYVMESVYRKNGILYVPSALSVLTGVYRVNGQRITVDFKKGYYKYSGGGGGILATVTSSGISGLPEYLGESFTLKLYR